MNTQMMNPNKLGELHGLYFADADPEHVAQLADSMRMHGYDLDHPVVVVGRHRREVVAGRHRTLAARTAGVEVPVILLTWDDFDALEAQSVDLDEVEAKVLARR